MKKTILVFGLVLAASVAGLFAQSAPSSIQFQTPPPATSVSVSASVVGQANFGVKYYWVVVNYPIGPSVPVGPAVVTTAPSPLTASNYVRVSWTSVVGASSYTVLTNTINSVPANGSTSVVAANTALTSVVNDNTALGVYAAGTAVGTVQGSITLNNKDFATPRYVFDPALSGFAPSTVTGVYVGDGTNVTGVVAASQLQYLRRKANVSATTYEFATAAVAEVVDYNWSQTPGGSVAIGANTITLTPVPLGISGSAVGNRVYLSGGVGTAEPVLITGGTAVSGAASGTLTFTAVNTHSGAWAVSSASFGLQEAINVLGAGNGGTAKLPTGTSVLRGTVTIDYSNISIVGAGGGCCSLGSTIERTGDFGDSIQVGTSTQQRNMVNFSDFAMTHVINYVSGNPGTISNKPTSGAHIRLWGTNTANINRMRLENMVNNLVITGAPLVTVTDSSFLGLWNPASATVQVTETSVLVNQTVSGVGSGIPTYISLLNNVFFGYPSSSPGYPNVGPRQSVEIKAVEDLIIDGGSMGGSSVNNVRLNPTEIFGTSPSLVMNVRITNVKFDSTNAADVELTGDGVIRSNNVVIANNIFNGETVGANAILVADPGVGPPVVTGLVVTGNNAMAYVKTPFMFLDGKGFTVTGNSIRYYNTSNAYVTEADASAIYFGGRSDQALVTGNQVGGAASYEPFGSGGNNCLFGISIALPLTTQNGVRLLGNYPAYWTALGTPYSGPVFSTTIPTIPGRAFKFSEPTVDVPLAVRLSSIDDQTGALIPSEFRSTNFNFLGGRSFFSAVSEPFAIGAKFAPTGGSVFFGATNVTATPDAQISNGGGAALMTLLTGGNVGIGTQLPRAKLSVLQSGTANTTADTLGPAVFTGPTPGGYAGMLVVESNDDMAADKGGSIGFYGRNTSASTNSSYFSSIHGRKENGTSGDRAGYLAFKVRTTGNADNEVMRIASTGNVGIGTSTDGNFKLDVATSGSSGTLRAKDATPTTGATSVLFDIGASQTAASTIFTINGIQKFAGTNTTGAGTALLGANSPAVTNTAPYTWIQIVTADGSTAYIPAWK